MRNICGSGGFSNDGDQHIKNSSMVTYRKMFQDSGISSG